MVCNHPDHSYFGRPTEDSAAAKHHRRPTGYYFCEKRQVLSGWDRAAFSQDSFRRSREPAAVVNPAWNTVGDRNWASHGHLWRWRIHRPHTLPYLREARSAYNRATILRLLPQRI